MSLAITGLFRYLGAMLPIPFSYIHSLFPSCGMYYYCLNIIIGVFALLTYILVAQKYRYPKRDDFGTYIAMQGIIIPRLNRNIFFFVLCLDKKQCLIFCVQQNYAVCWNRFVISVNNHVYLWHIKHLQGRFI